MNSFTAKQSILNLNKEIIAYELLFRNSLKNHFPDNVSAEEATANLITDQFFSQSAVDKLVEGKFCFLNFPYSLLVKEIPTVLPSTRIVIEILEDVPADDVLLNKIQSMRKAGFKFALDDFTMNKSWERFLNFIDIIKFDFKAYSKESISDFIKQHKVLYPKMVYLAEKIETTSEFNFAVNCGCTLFQGYYFNRPEIISNISIQGNHTTVTKLLSLISSPHTDVEQIFAFLKEDVSLTYRFLRFINNIHGSNTKITSLKEAYELIGYDEFKKLITLLSATSDLQTVPEELYQRSLTRAVAAEKITGQFFSDKENPDTAFMTGALSLMESITGYPLENILSGIPVHDEIKGILLHNQGTVADILNIVRACETADLAKLKYHANLLKIPLSEIIIIYQDSCKWTNKILAG